MKLQGQQALSYFARPDAGAAGLLLHGPDAMRIALRRQEVIKALVGPDGEAEMRLSRMSAAELRKDPAQLLDAVKAQGFFPGPRVVFVEDATDSHVPVITDALADWQQGDAQIIVTAGSLKAASKLRKLFEGHATARSVAIYADPPSREEIEARLKAAGVGAVDPDAMRDLVAMAQALDPGEFGNAIEKLALYKFGDENPVSSVDILAIAPQSTEADLDDVLNIVAEARSGEIGPIMRRLKAQGVQPVGLCIGAMRHFRTLYAAAAHPGGPAQGMSSVRPPVFGPRRDRMIRQAQSWGAVRLQQAVSLLMETDLAMRSAGQTAPSMALVERALVRLSMLARSRG